MKTNIISGIIALALTTVSITSCIDDESSYVGSEVANIEVSGIEDNYEAVSYAGQHLKISPIVKTDCASVKYEWYLCTKLTGSLDAKGDTIKPVLISTEKDLDYEVNLSPAQYQLRLKCIGDNGFVNTIATYFNVVTEFSKGFYILKETADGNTDIDLFTLNGTKTDDLLNTIHGKHMNGAPYMMNVSYDGFYINEETNKMEGTNKIVITTETGDFAAYRCTDLKKIFDRSNITFDGLADDEKIITIYNTDMRENMLTSKGTYSINNNNRYVALGYYSPNSGRFPLPNEACCSRNFIVDFRKANGSGIFWDEKDCSIKGFGSSCAISPIQNSELDEIEEVKNLVGYKCLYTGVNSDLGKSFMLLEGPDGKRKLVRFSGEYIRAIYGYICAFVDMIDIPSSNHITNASLFATCGLQAPYLYAIEGNKLYGTNFNAEELPELPLPLEGISSGEKITYITNQYYSYGYTDIDYLIIGTESGDNYNLYMYKTSNGVPDGKPVMQTSGKGKVKGVRFLTDGYNSSAYRSITD